MTPLERAARAAHEALSRANVIAYLDMPEETANIIARAVVEAIREPSEKMIDDIRNSEYGGIQGVSADIFKVMIDTALEEG